MSTPIQAAREIAARIFEQADAKVSSPSFVEFCAEIRRGDHDSHTAVQAALMAIEDERAKTEAARVEGLRQGIEAAGKATQSTIDKLLDGWCLGSIPSNVHDLADYLARINDAIRALAPPAEPSRDEAVRGLFKIGDRVTKRSGSSWTGYVVGTYSTKLTPEGYAIESENEPGSVQIYPAAALAAAKVARLPGTEDVG